MRPYKILGVLKTAADDEIKKAYRDLAKKHHPDLNPYNNEAEQKFREISAAYSLIATKERRAKFEKGKLDKQAVDARFGSGPFYHKTQESGGRYTNYYKGNDENFFKPFFSKFTGKSGRIDMPGQDHFYKIEIHFKDAVFGVKREIMLVGGKRLKFTIPAGIEEGAKLRIKEKGGPGIGKGKPGDAYIEVSFSPSATFKKTGNDIEVEIPISLDEAINGIKIKALTIDSAVLLTIPPGVNSGTKLRIKGKGLPHKHGNGRADQIVVLKLVLPEKTDSEFNAFIKKWSNDHPYNPRKKSIV